MLAFGSHLTLLRTLTSPNGGHFLVYIQVIELLNVFCRFSTDILFNLP